MQIIPTTVYYEKYTGSRQVKYLINRSRKHIRWVCQNGVHGAKNVTQQCVHFKLYSFGVKWDCDGCFQMFALPFWSYNEQAAPEVWALQYRLSRYPSPLTQKLLSSN